MWKYTELSYYISALYYRQDEIEDILRKAGIGPQFVRTSSKATTYWTNIISYAEQKQRVQALVETVINDDHKDDRYLLAFLADENTDFRSPYRKQTLDLRTEPTGLQMEVLTMGSSTFLHISFLSAGIEKAKTVVKIDVPKAMGSGFIIANNYLVTNNHVIGNIEIARHEQTKFYCNFEEGKQEEDFKLAPDSPNGFATSVKNDWTAVKIDTSDNAKREKLKVYDHLPLEEIEIKKDDFVNIIQHPGGKFKQIALYHNMVVSYDDSRVLYLTDTMKGSSGSPVFNSKWEVVALHHRFDEVMIKGTNGKQLVNEGININLVIKEMKENGITLS